MKMMKVGRKIFFARVPYNRPGTFAGTVWDHSDTYYELLVINFRVLVLNVFDTPEVMTGHVLNVIPGQRGALRVSPAETRLTVYRRRLVRMQGQASLDPKNDS